MIAIDITAVKVIKITPPNSIPRTIQKSNIKNVDGNFFDFTAAGQLPHRETYTYPTITKVTISMSDGTVEEFECQDVTNQATWSGGTLVDLQQAVADITASL